MSLKTLELVFEKILNNSRYRIQGKVCLWNGGEPLLHPQFDEIVDILASYQDSPYQFALITNGAPLTVKKAHKIIDSPNIDEIVFSLDGGTPELFEKMRAPAKWDFVSQKLHYFLDLNEASVNPVNVTINMVLDPSQDTTSIHPDFQALIKRVDRLDQNYPQAEAGLKPSDYIDRYDYSQGICAWVKARQYVVLWDGRITMCCSDLNGSMAFGELENFDDSYSGATRRHYLKEMILNQRHFLQGCSGCNQPEVLTTSDGTGFWDQAHLKAPSN